MNKNKNQGEKPFNPLDKKNLGISVADALIAKEPVDFPVENHFEGAGIYAIYYTGSFQAYRKIANRNKESLCVPIYVGKAVPAGARKGGLGLDIPPGLVLYKRLCEHAQTIDQVHNLELADFKCKYLVVDDIWIPLGESLLIEVFSPVWNIVIDGFGNHDPGNGRYNQKKSAWDVLHPGRTWAEKLQPNEKSTEELIEKIRRHLDSKL